MAQEKNTFSFKNQFNLAIGIGYHSGMLKYTEEFSRAVGAFSLKADIGISKQWGLGFYASTYAQTSSIYADYPLEVASTIGGQAKQFSYGMDYNEWNLGMIASWHFGKSKWGRLDPYIYGLAGVQFSRHYGYEFSGVGTTASNKYEHQMIEEKYQIPLEIEQRSLKYSDSYTLDVNYLKNHQTNFAYALAIGTNYRVNEYLGLFAELSYGINYGTIGIVCHLK